MTSFFKLELQRLMQALESKPIIQEAPLKVWISQKDRIAIGLAKKKAVFECMKTGGPMSRYEISEATGIVETTVKKCLNDFSLEGKAIFNRKDKKWGLL